MSEMNEKDQGTKKKLKLSKEVIESLRDEDLDEVVGGGAVPPNGPQSPSDD